MRRLRQATAGFTGEKKDEKKERKRKLGGRVIEMTCKESRGEKW